MISKCLFPILEKHEINDDLMDTKVQLAALQALGDLGPLAASTSADVLGVLQGNQDIETDMTCSQHQVNHSSNFLGLYMFVCFSILQDQTDPGISRVKPLRILLLWLQHPWPSAK